MFQYLNVKAIFETLLTERYAKYGVASEVLTLESNTSVSCGLISTGWSSWGFASVLPGWMIELNLMKDVTSVSFVQKRFPDAEVRLYEHGLRLLVIHSIIKFCFGI
jgi:hypothetical protein